MSKYTAVLSSIKAAATHQWPEILAHIGGCPLDILDGGHHPCPKCGGENRFRLIDKAAGAVLCNQCFNSRNGDGIAAIGWLRGWGFGQVIEELAKHLRISVDEAAKSKYKPADNLKPQPWHDALVRLWARHKPGISIEAVAEFGGGLARYRDQHQVIALPIVGPDLDHAKPCGHAMYNATGRDLPIYQQGKPARMVKIKTLEGSAAGLIASRAALAALLDPIASHLVPVTFWWTEGPSDALALWTAILPDERHCHLVLTNSAGAKEKRSPAAFASLFTGHQVNVVHDADEPGEDGAAGKVAELARAGAIVRHVRLPFDIAPDHGKDLRDWINGGGTFGQLCELAATVEPAKPEDLPTTPIVNDEPDDPHKLARGFLAQHAPLKFHREEFCEWTGQVWRIVQESEVRAAVTRYAKDEFDRLNIEALANSTADEPPTVLKVTATRLNNAINAIKAETILSSYTEPNTWLGSQTASNRCLAMENGILDVDALLAGRPVDEVLLPHTADWFSFVALPYRFDIEATCPRWLEFLSISLESDPERIAVLQEWAGYLLLPSTDSQKFLILEGEGANGKSVYCAALEAVIGQQNASHIPLELFGQRFALTETLNKLCNVAAEVGEIDKIAEGFLKSFTSGDRMFFDRKGKTGLNATPTARLVLATNNRPRFSDRSGGIWRRILLVPFDLTIDKADQIKGMDKPEWWAATGELPGILNWAIAGLARLKENRGEFTDSQVVADAIEDYRNEVNPARSFLQENCVAEPLGRVPTDDLYSAYDAWCKKHGHRPLADRSFGKEVFRVFRKAMKRKIGNRRERFRVYDGIIMVSDGTHGTQAEF